MNKTLINKKLAFSLVEILLAISLLTLAVFTLGNMVIEAYRSNKNQADRNAGIYYMKEMFNAVSISKNDLWGSIINNTGNGSKHLNFVNNKYIIEDGVTEINGIDVSFTVGTVNRDSNGNIVMTGGVVDVHTRVINVTSSWLDVGGATTSLTSSVYLNDWSTLDWTQTTAADFTTGALTNTAVVNNEGGEVQLGKIFYPDWCKPSLSVDAYDIPGSAVAKTLTSTSGLTYMGTGGVTGGVAVTKVRIEGVEEPTVTVEGTFNGYLTNNIFISGDYAYLAVDTTQVASPNTNSKQVVILDVSQTPFTEVGYFKASANGEALSVYAVGNNGYAAIGRYVYTFDITSKVGVRPQRDSLRLSIQQNSGKIAYVSQIIVKNNYLYASLYEDWYELAIANVTNPANITLTSESSVNDGQAEDIDINAAGTRVYFGTTWISNEPNFFIVNVTNKTQDNLPKIGTYKTVDRLNIVGVANYEADKRVVIVGYGGTQQYQALNIATETKPVLCGGMAESTGINDVDTVKDIEGNAFAYYLTNDPSKEFKIIRGGPGGGGDGTGYGYLKVGSYESIVLDSTSTTTSWYYVDWKGLIPAGTALTLQFRAGTTPDLSALPWLGPDGTSATFYSTIGAAQFPSTFKNKRYIQYMANLGSVDTLGTSRLDSVRINYEK